MSFGQPSGPPASARQVRELQSLVEQAGFDGFREARHPLGLTQRQAAGKFTSQEAATLIDQLQATESNSAPQDAPPPSAGTPSIAAQRRADAARARQDTERAPAVRDMPADTLAHELERRGWVVIPPPDDPPPRQR